MTTIRFLDYLFTKKVFDFKHPTGNYSLKFPNGWRMKKINSSEHLFTEISTNHGIIINVYSITDKSLDSILKSHRDKCLEKEFCPQKQKFKDFNLISWVYNFDRYKTIELKRIYYNSATILDVSFCIKSDMADDKIEVELLKEKLLFQTLELKKN